MSLIFFLLMAIMLITLIKIFKWCYYISEILKSNSTKETKEYVDQAIKEGRKQKEKIKQEVLDSKYLSDEYLIVDHLAGNDFTARHKVDELIKGMEKE